MRGWRLAVEQDAMVGAMPMQPRHQDPRVCLVSPSGSTGVPECAGGVMISGKAKQDGTLPLASD